MVTISITMNKITVVKNTNYTVISNVILRDKRLSLKAKGLLITVLGLPDDWDFTIRGIVTTLKEGRDSITAAIAELVEFNYCSRTEERDETGKFIGIDYTFYEAPILSALEPITENPITDNPPAENSPQLSKQNPLSKQEYKNDSYESDNAEKEEILKEQEAPNHPSSLKKDIRSAHPAIVAVRTLMKRFPDQLLWDKIIDQFGESFDEAKMKACRIAWLERGYNANSMSWLNWYKEGIPTRNGSAPTTQVRNQPTQREAIEAELRALGQ